MAMIIKYSYTECHLEDSDDDGEFHLERVEVIELVRGAEPFGVEAEWVHAAFFLRSELFNWRLAITAAENVQRQGEELVVDPARVE